MWNWINTNVWNQWALFYKTELKLMWKIWAACYYGNSLEANRNMATFGSLFHGSWHWLSFFFFFPVRNVPGSSTLTRCPGFSRFCCSEGEALGDALWFLSIIICSGALWVLQIWPDISYRRLVGWRSTKRWICISRVWESCCWLWQVRITFYRGATDPKSHLCYKNKK